MLRNLLVMLIALIGISTSISAQNLVLNPSFENINPCPVGPGELLNAASWTLPSGGTADLYNACVLAPLSIVGVPNNLLGFQPAHTGDGYAGFISFESDAFIGCTYTTTTNYREYVQGELSSPLIAGQEYCVSFWVSLADNAKFGSDNIGVHFSNSIVNPNVITTPLTLTPQLTNTSVSLADTIDWIELQWSYTATGGETHFIIGNFDDDATTTEFNNNCLDPQALPFAYYFIDDVSVTAGSCNVTDTCFTVSIDTLVNPTCGNSDGIIDINAVSGDTSCFSSVVTLNEIFINPSGPNDGANPNAEEYIELIGPPGTDLSCYSLTDGDWLITIPMGSTIPADGFFTIGNDAVWGAGTFDLDAESCNCFIDGVTGSGLLIFTNGGEYLAMFNSLGNFVEGVQYGNPSTANTPPNGGTTGGGVIGSPGIIGCPSFLTIPSPAAFDITTVAPNNGEGIAKNPDGSGTWVTAGPTLGTCNFAGAATVTYAWSNGATTDSIFGLAGGDYIVTITDGACTTIDTFTLASANAPVITESITDVTCSGGNNGAINLTISNGTAPYTYAWSNGGTVEDLAGLSGGTYSVTVTGNDGCFTTATYTIQEPTALSTTFIETPADCGVADGSIDLTVSGGNPTYNFAWSNGTNTEDLTNINAGTYTVTITDANGCTLIDTVNVTNINGPTITLDSLFDASCNGSADGSIHISLPDTGSTGSNCTPPAIVTINEIFVNPPNGIPDGTDPNTGEYIELFGNPGTDISCYVLTDGDWTITIPQGTIIPTDGFFTIGNDAVWGAGTFDLDAENCNCFTDGPAGGGLLIFSNSGEYLAMFDGSGAFLEGVQYGVTPSATNIPPGGNIAVGGVINTAGVAGCVTSVTIPGPAAFANIALDPGNNEGISKNPDGATALSTWVIAGPTLNGCNFGSPSTSNSFSVLWSTGDTTTTVTGLAAGDYTITVTDSLGCLTIDTFTVNEPTAIQTTITTVDASCGGNDGSATVVATDGTAPYTFAWDNSATTATITALAAGDYIVTVTDSLGCIVIDTATINSINILSVNDTTSNISCNGNADGIIGITPLNGIAPYTYAWDNGATTALVSNLDAGTYSVTVSDANGCSAVITNTITEPTTIVIQEDTVMNVSCNGDTDGVIDLTTTGGVTPYTYAWDNGATTEDLNSLSPDTYSLTVTDSTGCIATGIYIIQDPVLLTVAVLDNVDSIECDQIAIGELEAIASGGTGTINYTWSNGTATAINSSLDGGTYIVTVTDINGCTAVDSFSIFAPIPANVDAIYTDGSEALIINQDETAAAEVSNPSTDLSYQWTTNPDFGLTLTGVNTTSLGITGTTGGDYQLIVTASSVDGCTAVDSISLEVIPNFLGMPNAFTPGQDGTNDILAPVNLDAEYILEFKIYNRFGELVYDNPELTGGGWDGTYKNTDQPRDSYQYILRYQLPTDTEEQILRGSVILIR